MILLVDDNTLIEDWLRTVIQESGYYFDAAVDGEIALYKMSRIFYSLAFIDIGLPNDMSGIELARNIKRLDAPASSTPLIAITGGIPIAPDDVHLFVHFLYKPFLPVAVREAIANFARPPIKDLHNATDGDR